MAAGYKEIEVQYIKTAFETPKNKPWYAEMLEKSDDVAQLVKNTETNGFYRIQSLPSLIDPSSPTFSNLKGKHSGSRTYAFLYHIAASLAEYARDSEDNSVQEEMAHIIAELHKAFHMPLIGGWTGFYWDNISLLKNTFLGDPNKDANSGVFSDLEKLLKKLVDNKINLNLQLDKLLVSLYLCMKCIRFSVEQVPALARSAIPANALAKIDSLLQTIEECHRKFLENKMAKSEEIIAQEVDKEKEPASEEESFSEEEKESEAGPQESKEGHIIRLFSDLILSLEDLVVDKNIAAAISQVKDAIVLEIKKMNETEREGEEDDSQEYLLDSMSESIVNIEGSIDVLRRLLSHLNDPAVTNKLDNLSRAIYHSLSDGLADDFKQAEEVIYFLRNFDPETAKLLEDVDMSASKEEAEEAEEGVFEEEKSVQRDISSDTNVKEFSFDDGNDAPIFVLTHDSETSSSSVSSVKDSEGSICLKYSGRKSQIDSFFLNLKEPRNPLEFTYKECVANLRALHIDFFTGHITNLDDFKSRCAKVIDDALRASHGFSKDSLKELRQAFNGLFQQELAGTSSTFFPKKGQICSAHSKRNDLDSTLRKGR